LEVQDPHGQAKVLQFSPGLKRLDVDVKSYAWSEDYFDFLFEAPTPTQPNKSEQNLRIFHKLELGLWELMAEQQAALTDIGRQLLTRHLGDKPILNFEAHASLFPWLPWPDRKIFLDADAPFVLLEPQFDLKGSLAGQRKDELSLRLGVIRVVPKEVETTDVVRGGAIPTSRRDAEELGFELATFELVSLSFEEGSIFATARVRRKILASAMAILGLGFISTPISKGIDAIYTDHVIASQVEKAPKDPVTFRYCGSRLSFDKLRENTERSFDYNEKGISKLERECRIAQEQIALGIALHTDLVVDGKLGPQTLAHEKQFGTFKHVPGTNQSPFFRGQLTQVFRPSLEKEK
jgi:hypothetical protein